ncbi:hypothetical protein Forpi1262_v004093 [Fusarium oxysporum f. sp. raphani]|uniref:Uncharacterized protein n=1 Tax=Fusarium oxysporum f. sp. raphani TaxID=96318 RepID=A0A8J5UGC3_FUSOX|nr:hypothetical protein Forpi1262_v004093 [Fusarium oxysporum f. sp. raphani]
MRTTTCQGTPGTVNHKALVNSLGDDTPLSVYILSCALAQAHPTPPLSKDWCHSCWCRSLKGHNETQYGHNDLGINNTNKKEIRGKKEM